MDVDNFLGFSTAVAVAHAYISDCVPATERYVFIFTVSTATKSPSSPDLVGSLSGRELYLLEWRWALVSARYSTISPKIPWLFSI